MARIKAVQDLSPEVQEILATRIARDGGVKDVYRVLANHPDLMRVFCAYSDVLNRRGRLPANVREAAILRTAYRTGARYEAVHHLARAREAGLRDGELAKLDEAEPEGMEPELAVVVRAVDELCCGDAINEETLTDLESSGLTPDLLVELILLVGFYRMIAGLVNSAALDAAAKEEAQ